MSLKVQRKLLARLRGRSVVVPSVSPARTIRAERDCMTLEALADVDARRTVTHGEIEAWAKGLGKPKRERGS